MDNTVPKVETLVLDAGPLLSLLPLRGLAKRYITVPQVIEELKDKRARDHFEQLALTSGVHVEVKHPGALALTKGGVQGFQIYRSCAMLNLLDLFSHCIR